MVSGSVHALFAGLVASVSSVCAKLSVGANYITHMCESGLGHTHTGGEASVCDWLQVPLRLLCAGLLLACNTVMWTLFAKALRLCSSSARATVTTTASNFLCSAVLGRLLFGETHDALWWAGISLTLCGLLLLHGSTARTLQQGHEKDE
ncbi:transmembrane protein 42-like [Salarias fasciatus]|uniref:transmembrane protein 42-like n=1 Tax=Salarias fasciatus TaxID=181472 RepID=UPI001176742C|nr:transmembrane protein 42-like [Salarias fasciatus]